eukprot:125853_1
MGLDAVDKSKFYCWTSYLLYPICKYLISIFIALSVTTKQRIYIWLWCLTLLFAITVYVITSLSIVYSKCFTKATYTKVSTMFTFDAWFQTLYDHIIRINLNTNKKIILTITHLISLEIGVLLHIIAWLTDSVQYLFFISIFFITFYASINLYIHFIVAASDNYCDHSTIFILSIIQYLMLICYMLCISLKYDFNINIHDLVLFILIILTFMLNELRSSLYFTLSIDQLDDAIGTTNPMCTCIPYLCCLCIPKCCELAGFIVFFILFCMNYNNTNQIIYAFIPLWCMWFCQCCQAFCKFTCSDDPQWNSRYEGSTNKIIKHAIIRHTLNNDQLLNKINRCLEHKRIGFVGNTRLRCENVICDIISPNHVALTAKEYMSFGYLENISQHELHDFYQWIPTEFMLTFKSDYIYDEINIYNNNLKYEQFMDIELKSGFIPDLNCKEYQDLTGYILILLKTIVPLFVQNEHGKSNYNKILFEWCKTNKILAIIVKSQQYEWTENVEIDEYSGSFHTEGTSQEKITQIAVLCTRVDSDVYGGDLYLQPLDENAYDSSQPFSNAITEINNINNGDIVIFKNTLHKMNTFKATHKSDTNPPIRRILAFFLCENNPFENKYYESVIYRHLIRDDENVTDSDTEFWKIRKIISQSPLITATDTMPILKNNFNDYIELILGFNRFNIQLPEVVVNLIIDYAKVIMLRDEQMASNNAKDLRQLRGYANEKRQRLSISYEM